MGRIVIEGKRGRLVFTAGFFLMMAWLTLTVGAVGMHIGGSVRWV